MDGPASSALRRRDTAQRSGAPHRLGAPGSPRRAERGSGTVLGVALMLVLVGALVATALLGRAMDARARARTGADLCALAAATALSSGGDVCTAASRVADENGVELVSCRVDGYDVIIVTREEVGLGILGSGAAEAHARAGPAMRGELAGGP